MKFAPFLIPVYLLIPTFREAWRDRRGDAHPNDDWKSRSLACIIAGLLCTISSANKDYPFAIQFIRFTGLSVGVFIATFNYLVNYIHLRYRVTRVVLRGNPIEYEMAHWTEVVHHVLDHLSDRAWPDKEPWWRKITWRGRLVVNVLGLVVFIILATII